MGTAPVDWKCLEPLGFQERAWPGVLLGRSRQRPSSAPALQPSPHHGLSPAYTHTIYHWLPSTLMRLRKNLPELEVTLAVEHTYSPVAALEAGELDVALVTTSPLSGRVSDDS
ncbi:LysR substrate-binding domain-containing protein [Cystobacter ferrugineus]|uniref:LysR substrate-binding domain-containing protein n=1 Tax=Cystobacter ferrugineus TaxID=83449 RepID=A0A1L9ATP2_9BACT|nr:LysR substrate-binding domain-containing protein [Cystobacter ferrugineus]OJH33380.1 hypothetical protein BON30_49045 [Cystobacter ferrugineus]